MSAQTLRLAGRGARTAPIAAAGFALIAAGFVLSISPLLAFGVVAAAAYLSLVVLRPKMFVALAGLVVLFATTGEQLTGIHPLKFADDAMVVTAVVALPLTRLLRGKTLRALPGMWSFCGFACLGLLGDLVQHVPMNVSTEGGYLALKGILFGFAVAQLDWDAGDVRKIARFGCGIATFILSCCVLNLMAPHTWTSHILVSSLNGGYRLGVQSLVGPFIHPGTLGQIAALSAIALVAYHRVFGRSGRVGALSGAMAVAAALSFRRKAVTGMLLGALVVALRNRPARALIVLAVVLPSVVVLSWSQITAVVTYTQVEYLGQNQTKIARTVLYSTSPEIARESFPLGAGFGRFGTHTAIAHYSPLYRDLGFTHVYGLEPGGGVNGDFGSDTYWPGVLGETGFLGLAMFLGGLVALWQRFRRYSIDAEPWIAWLGLVGMGWSLEYLVESFASADYTGPPVYPFLFALGGIASAACSSVLSATHGTSEPSSAQELPQQLSQGQRPL